jgi:hypothetical protein
MAERSGLFAVPKHAVQSLSVQAETYVEPRPQGQFEVLVRHLFHRFLNNELLTSDDETKRVMLISYTAALPGLVAALFLYPMYHAFPPNPYPRPFWPQVCDHYLYVMYAFVVMGAATVYEWDLLFPDLLDVFVLSPLPVESRRLFGARVLALAIFFGLVLLGTSGLGMVFFPISADLPDLPRHYGAHAAAVLMSGVFAATFFLSVQGVLLNVAGERLFRRITPILQAGSIMVLLTVLLLTPAVTQSMEALLGSGSAAVRWFPPFWFLGLYERLLDGAGTPGVFDGLARRGCYAVLLLVACTVLTYPLAYRRRVRQLVEGVSALEKPSVAAGAMDRVLHGTILPLPGQRAIFHFIQQTILRSQRQRVMLAMYGGFGIALVLAVMVVLRPTAGHLRVALLPGGIRAAIPMLSFWTVAGLSAVAGSPVDRRGAWLFRVLFGRARRVHLGAARIWITLCAAGVSVAAVGVLHLLAPAALRGPRATACQLLVAVGSSFVLTDLFLFPVRTFPFTHLRRSSFSDFPLMLVRNAILFPFFVVKTVEYEPFLESSVPRLVGAGLVLAGVHLALLYAQARSLAQTPLDAAPDDEDEFPQRLGLREA